MTTIKYQSKRGLKSSDPAWAQIDLESSLSTALDLCQSDRLFLCGSLSEMSREYVEEPLSRGWSFTRQYVHKFRSPEYENEAGKKISVKLVSGSWLPGCESLLEAVPAWCALKDEWRQTKLPLMTTPAATGMALLWELLPQGEEFPVLSEEMARHIRRISPQHRLEVFRPGYKGPQRCYDGRFMYAAMLGLDRFPVGEPIETRDFQPYQPGWYRVRATVPRDWAHVGLLPTPDIKKAEDSGKLSWLYPNAPGECFEVWAGEPELTLALRHGWSIEVIEGWKFEKGRPLATWGKKLVAMRDRLTGRNEYARAAVREMLIHTIGRIHKNTVEREKIVTHSEWRELIEAWGYAEVRTLEKFDDGTRRVEYPEASASGFMIFMPHWSATVYGLARARVAESALRCDPAALIEIRGDAIYADRELPFSDNHRLGQIRLKEVSERG